MTTTKDANGKLLSVTKRGQGNGRGVNLDVLYLYDDTYVTIDEDDIDADLVAEFFDESIPVPDVRRSRQLRTSMEVHHERSLQNYDVVELDVLADQTFCTAYGGSGEAVARVQSIVAEISKFYEVHGIKMKVKSITMECTNGKISNLVNSNSQVCGNDPTLLSDFREYVARQSLTGDLVHLFHGKNFDGRTIGCAYEANVLCRYDGFNTGVNEMTWSTNLINQGSLGAHEIGHNLDASHFSGTLMAGSVCGRSSCRYFDSSTVRTFVQSIQSAPNGCISLESAPGSPTNRPTNSPTKAPTTVSNPPPAVCGRNKATCSSNSDCCSFKCNRGFCKGNGR
jgi:Metallo-peptidase family M12